MEFFSKGGFGGPGLCEWINENKMWDEGVGEKWLTRRGWEGVFLEIIGGLNRWGGMVESCGSGFFFLGRCDVFS